MKNLYKVASERKFRGIFEIKKSTETAEITSTTETKDLVGVARKDIKYSNAKIGDFKLSDLQTEQLDALFGGLFGKLIKLLENFDEKPDTSTKKSESTKENDDKNTAKNNDNQKKLEVATFGMEHNKALNIFKKAGFKFWASKGHITSDRLKDGGTSFTNILPSTVEGMVKLKNKFGKPMILTGGTEIGPHSAVAGHEQGEKVDASKDPDFAKFIQENTTIHKSINPMTAPDKTKYELKIDNYTYIILAENDPQHFDISPKKIV